MTFTRILGVLSLVLPATPALAEPNCEAWNTVQYFQTAALEEVTASLDAGADPKARDAIGLTPLHWAAVRNENLAVIGALLDAGSDLAEI